MVLTGDLITKEHAPNMYFSSYEGKYNIMDNLDEKSDPLILARDEVYNSEYVYVTVVLRGTLHIIIGGTELEVKANEYLAVTPCMSVKVKDSRCLFFAFLTRSHIMSEIYERIGVQKYLHFHAFKFRHVHLPPEVIGTLYDCYKRIKAEHMRPEYPMKEMTLRAYQGCYIAKLFSYVKEDDIINHVKNSRQYQFFNNFISKLNEKHRQERSVQFYANELNITPKYLSAIVQNFTGLTASQVIDQYVIFAVKQTLYSNKANIKTISKDFNFPSQSFFGRYFKRITGMSPNEYIKQNNIKSINFVQN